MVILPRFLSSQVHYHTIFICTYITLMFDHKEVLFKPMNNSGSYISKQLNQHVSQTSNLLKLSF